MNSALNRLRVVQQNDHFLMSPTEQIVKENHSVICTYSQLFSILGRQFTNTQPINKLEFSTPVRSITPDLYSRVPSSIKRSRITPSLASTYETPPPPAPFPSTTSTNDSAE